MWRAKRSTACACYVASVQMSLRLRLGQVNFIDTNLFQTADKMVVLRTRGIWFRLPGRDHKVGLVLQTLVCLQHAISVVDAYRKIKTSIVL